MTLMLAAVAVYTILGGMLSVLVTDYLQFLVMSAGLLAVTVLILWDVPWERMVATVEKQYGAGGFNPFVNPDQGWSYVIFNGLQNRAAVLTWQTTIARVLSSKDAGTGRRIYTHTSFFFVCRFVIPGLWGIAALAMLPETTGMLPRLAMPTYLASVVPMGLMGLLVAAMLAADMSTDSSYMLTWAGVIYNDILAPFRPKHWSERRGLLLNRAIVAVIGVFLFFYGLLYELKGDTWEYLTVTGTIYLSSMSTLLIACCYWKPANNWVRCRRDRGRRDLPAGLPGAQGGGRHPRICRVGGAKLFGHRRVCRGLDGNDCRLAGEAAFEDGVRRDRDVSQFLVVRDDRLPRLVFDDHGVRRHPRRVGHQEHAGPFGRAARRSTGRAGGLALFASRSIGSVGFSNRCPLPSPQNLIGRWRLRGGVEWLPG